MSMSPYELRALGNKAINRRLNITTYLLIRNINSRENEYSLRKVTINEHFRFVNDC